MKAGIIITGSGSILALTSTDYFEHPDFVDALMEKDIDKYIVFEVPEESQSLLFFKNNAWSTACSVHAIFGFNPSFCVPLLLKGNAPV